MQAISAAVAKRAFYHRAAIAKIDDDFQKAGARQAAQLPAD